MLTVVKRKTNIEAMWFRICSEDLEKLERPEDVIDIIILKGLAEVVTEISAFGMQGVQSESTGLKRM